MRNLTEIVKPETIEEAVQLLDRETPRTVALAGGTEVVGDADSQVGAVVDLSGLGLDTLRVEADGLHMGALVTLAALADAPQARAVAGGHLTPAARVATSSLLRRQATLGGSLLTEQAPELAALLLALGAETVIYTPTASRRPLAALYQGGSARCEGVLTEIIVPQVAAEGVGCHAVRRTPSDAPLVAVAVALVLDGGTVRRIGLAASGALVPRPTNPNGPRGWARRLERAEAALQGQALTNQGLEACVQSATSDLDLVTDYLASAEYRAAMVGVLLRRALGDAWHAAA